MSIHNEEVYSPATNTTYPNWDALVDAEANGWIAVLILQQKRKVFTYSVGPFETKAEAERARNRMRNKHERQFETFATDAQLLASNVKPVWKAAD